MNLENVIAFHGDVINCYYSDIVANFGEPTECDIDGKINFEWEITTPNGTTFTIYDWKKRNADVKNELIQWNIGRGANGIEVREFLESKGFKTDNIYF